MPRDAHYTLRFGLSLGEVESASVDVLLVCEPRSLPRDERAKEDALGRLHARVADLVGRFSPTVPVHIHVVEGKVHEEIASHTMRLGADMVLIRPGELERSFRTSSRRIHMALCRCSCSVLFLPMEDPKLEVAARMLAERAVVRALEDDAQISALFAGALAARGGGGRERLQAQ